MPRLNPTPPFIHAREVRKRLRELRGWIHWERKDFQSGDAPLEALLDQIRRTAEELGSYGPYVRAEPGLLAYWERAQQDLRDLTVEVAEYFGEA